MENEQRRLEEAQQALLHLGDLEMKFRSELNELHADKQTKETEMRNKFEQELQKFQYQHDNEVKKIETELRRVDGQKQSAQAKIRDRERELATAQRRAA